MADLSQPYTGAVTAQLDASGLSCPMPLLKAKLELNRLASGEILAVVATDAGSQRDFRTFAKLSGMPWWAKRWQGRRFATGCAADQAWLSACAAASTSATCPGTFTPRQIWRTTPSRSMRKVLRSTPM